MSSRSPYATDLSDEEWWILEPLTSLKLVTRRQAPRPRDPRAIGRHLLRSSARRLRLAPPSSRVPALADDLPLLPYYLAPRWYLGADQQSVLRERLRAMAGREAMCPARRSWTVGRRGPRRKAALKATTVPRR
jgi:hypothetical protein